MKELTLDQAIETAIKMDAAFKDDNVEKESMMELEKAVMDFQEEGYPIEVLIPKDSDAAMGFSLKSADGKNFWEIYSKLIRNQLCKSDGELYKLTRSGISTSVGATLTAIVTGLGIPSVALGIMIPIAIIIANTGVDAFCEITDKEKGIIK